MEENRTLNSSQQFENKDSSNKNDGFKVTWTHVYSVVSAIENMDVNDMKLFDDYVEAINKTIHYLVYQKRIELNNDIRKPINPNVSIEETKRISLYYENSPLNTIENTKTVVKDMIKSCASTFITGSQPLNENTNSFDMDGYSNNRRSTIPVDEDSDITIAPSVKKRRKIFTVDPNYGKNLRRSRRIQSYFLPKESLPEDCTPPKRKQSLRSQNTPTKSLEENCRRSKRIKTRNALASSMKKIKKKLIN